MTAVCTHDFETALGTCSLGWGACGLTHFSLEAQTGNSAAPAGAPVRPPTEICALVVRVQRHLDGAGQDFSDVPLDWSRVTPFQRAVYVAAQRIKAGQVQTYGWLARELGRPSGASRAVGGALGRNPWLLLVPCHRVIGVSGGLTGFSAPGGVATKRRLLALEGADLAAL